MTSLGKVLCGRMALCATLSACGCEQDSTALFDAGEVPGFAGRGHAAAGSNAAAGETAGGDDGIASGGANTAGSLAVGGSSGSAAGGVGGLAGGAVAGGGSSAAGHGGTTDTAVAGGGSGGTKGEPDPVTITISNFTDANVVSCMSYSNFGDSLTIKVDDDYGCSYQGLLNPSLSEVPKGALVSEATLTLSCVDAGGELTVSYVNEPWQEDTVRYSNRPELGAVIGKLTCADAGPIDMDLTEVVAAWVSGGHAASGLYLITHASNGTDFASSEAVDPATRPSLSVTYTPAAK
jgi:hypothetical protein